MEVLIARTSIAPADPRPLVAYLLAIASAAFYGAADFLGGLASRRASTIAVVVWSQAAGLATLLVVLPVLPDASPSRSESGLGGRCGHRRQRRRGPVVPGSRHRHDGGRGSHDGTLCRGNPCCRRRPRRRAPCGPDDGRNRAGDDGDRARQHGNRCGSAIGYGAPNDPPLRESASPFSQAWQSASFSLRSPAQPARPACGLWSCHVRHP